VVSGGPQAVSEEKVLRKLDDTERMKNTPIYGCAKTAFVVDLQQNVGGLVLSITSCPTVIILENALN
jgi:hypothetical protein